MELRRGRITVFIEDGDSSEELSRSMIEVAALLIRAAADIDGTDAESDFKRNDATGEE